MKKIITILLMALSFSSYSQMDNILLDDDITYYDETYKPDLKLGLLKSKKVAGYHYSEPIIRTGPAMMLGGGLLWTVAVLTRPSPTWNGVPSTSPHVKSTPRFIGMTMGLITVTCGFVVTISGG